MKLQGAVRSLLAVAVVTVGMYIGTIGADAAGTCKVSEGAAKIRATASTSAEVVGSTSKGATLDVIASTNDGTNTWYKVYVEGDKTGYIRGDLVTDVQGDIKDESGATTTESSSTVTETSSSTVVEPCQYTNGSTKDQVSVRESASTNSTKKTTARAGQALSITGQATGDDGKIWYQVSYDNVTGFIRSDFIDTSAGSELGEPEVIEVPADDVMINEFEGEDDFFYEDDDVIYEDVPVATTINDDYELKYEANDEGVEMWYLYDHIKGTRQSLDNIFAVMQQSQNMQAQDSGDASKMRTIIIIMGVAILILVIAVTVLIFKLRDSYDDWDEEDDEEEEDEDEEPVKTKQPLFKKAPAKVVDQFEDDDDEELDDEDIKIVSRKSKPKKASSLTKPSKAVAEDRKEAWQSKNFLEIDDDMEFEFLDIDK